MESNFDRLPIPFRVIVVNLVESPPDPNKLRSASQLLGRSVGWISCE